MNTTQSSSPVMAKCCAYLKHIGPNQAVLGIFSGRNEMIVELGACHLESIAETIRQGAPASLVICGADVTIFSDFYGITK